jgi:hypothetical protein
MVGFIAYLAVGGLLVFSSSKEKISHPGIELPTASVRMWAPIHYHLVV